MDEFLKVTPGKKKLLEVLDSMKPFERIEIVADKDGKPDTFLVHRSSKVIITSYSIVALK